MDTKSALDIARGLWAEELRQRKQDFARKVRAIHERAAHQGIGRSGAHMSAVLDECVSEQRFRANIVRETLEQTISRVGLAVNYSTAQSMFNDLITNIYQDITAALDDALGVVPVHSDVRTSWMLGLGNEAVAAITHQEFALQLFVNAIPAQSSTPAVTVYGAFQTGQYATAHVTQHFSSQELLNLNELQRALTELRDQLAEIPATTSAVAIIDTATEEMRHDAPRKQTVLGLMTGLAASIEILGNVPAAWTTVKALAAGAGMHLP